jgi:hypothetical protein
MGSGPPGRGTATKFARPHEKSLPEDSVKVAMEVLSILAFLLGSPIYVQHLAEPLAPNHLPSKKDEPLAEPQELLRVD